MHLVRHDRAGSPERDGEQLAALVHLVEQLDLLAQGLRLALFGRCLEAIQSVLRSHAEGIPNTGRQGIVMDERTKKVYDVLHAQWGQRMGMDVDIQVIAERVVKALRDDGPEHDDEVVREHRERHMTVFLGGVELLVRDLPCTCNEKGIPHMCLRCRVLNEAREVASRDGPPRVGCNGVGVAHPSGTQHFCDLELGHAGECRFPTWDRPADKAERGSPGTAPTGASGGPPVQQSGAGESVKPDTSQGYPLVRWPS